MILSWITLKQLVKFLQNVNSLRLTRCADNTYLKIYVPVRRHCNEIITRTTEKNLTYYLQYDKYLFNLHPVILIGVLNN